MIAPREESRGPAGLVRRAASAAARPRPTGADPGAVDPAGRPRRGRARRRAPLPRAAADRRARPGRAGGAAAVGRAAGSARTAAARGGVRRWRPRAAAGPGGARLGCRPAAPARRRRQRAGGPGGADRGTAGGAGSPGTGCPVHSPPTPPRRRPVPSPVRAPEPPPDGGLFDAGAPGRVAPEDDSRGYPAAGPGGGRRRRALPPLRPGSSHRPAGPGRAARDPTAGGGVLGRPLDHPLAAPGGRRARAAGPDRGGAGRRPDPATGPRPAAARCWPAVVAPHRRPPPGRSAAERPARHHRPADPGRAAARTDAGRRAARGRGRLRHRGQLARRPAGPATAAFADSYRRTGRTSRTELFRQVTASSRRGDYEWAQWQRQEAVVRVEVVAVGVPDGAPAPTATTAYVRVQFRQVCSRRGRRARAGHRRRGDPARQPRQRGEAGWSPGCSRTPEAAVMTGGRCCWRWPCPSRIPLVLVLVAAFMVPAIAGGGSVSVRRRAGRRGGRRHAQGRRPGAGGRARLIGPSVQAAGSPHLTESVLAAQLYQESGFDPQVVSSAGAQGIAQFMPGTWAAHGRDENGDGQADPFDPEDAIPAAARYDAAVAASVAAVPGDRTSLMLAAYNAGPGRGPAVPGHPAVPGDPGVRPAHPRTWPRSGRSRPGWWAPARGRCRRRSPGRSS